MPTVIDLQEIQSRIEAQRVASEQTSRVTAQRALVETVWQWMSSMFGHRWTSAYGDEVDPDRVWAATLAGLTEQQVREGMRACAQRGGEWPPSAPEFRALCNSNWEHRQIAKADEDWKRRALPDMSQQNEAAIDDIRASIRAMLR